MNFTVENIVTLIVALLMGLPGIVNILNERKKSSIDYQTKLRLLTDNYIELLTVTSIMDTVLRKIFIDHPGINGELRQQWLETSTKLEKLRDRLSRD